MRRTIKSIPDNYTKSQKVFGVLFGLALIFIAGLIVFYFKPIIWWDLLVVLLMSSGLLILGAWVAGKRKWGIFLVMLVLGLPVLFRLNLLGVVSIATWLLILGLTALIN